MPENIVSVRLEIKNQKTRELLEEIISSTEGFRLQRSVTAACDILILEIGNDLKGLPYIGEGNNEQNIQIQNRSIGC